MGGSFFNVLNLRVLYHEGNHLKGVLVKYLFLGIFCSLFLSLSAFGFEHTNVYIHGFGGANYLILKDTGDAKLKAEPGYMFGAGVGLKFDNTRVEIEGAYRYNDFKDSVALGPNVFFDGGKTEKLTCFVNFFYDLPSDWFIDYLRPYIGLGAGYKFDWEEMRIWVFEYSQSDWGATYNYTGNGSTGQVILGVGLPITRSTITKIEYRLLKDENVTNHSVLLNLDRSF